MKKAWLWGLTALIIFFGCDSSNTPAGPTNPPGNQAPTVFVGDDRNVEVDSTVTLDGSNCSDIDGDTLTYDWQFASKPNGSTATLSDNTAINPTFSADLAGQYIVELTVSDGSTTSSDSVIITVSTGQTTSDCSQIVPGQNIADDFVCAHNDVRANAQPAPSPPLPKMTWDPALAQIAQDYAATCNWAHNPNRSDTYPEYVGENLYVTTWQNSTPADAIESWGDEIQYYDYDTNTCQSGEMCGHYTQIVWRSSVKVGCARVSCPTVTGINWNNADLYVCNYAPGGNINGRKPY